MTPLRALELVEALWAWLVHDPRGAAMRIAANRPGLSDPAAYRMKTYLRVRLMLPAADLVLWERPLWQAACRGAEHLAGTLVEPPLLERPQVWVWNGAAPVGAEVQQTLGLPVPYVLAALLLLPANLGVIPISILLASDAALPAGQSSSRQPDLSPFLVPDVAIPYGEPLEERHGLVYVGGLLFLKEPFVELQKGGIPRPERQGQGTPPIRVVALRSRETSHTQTSAPGAVEWTCQWLVRGHWRRQWHPSDRSHRPIYVRPYVKGPGDKPFRPPKVSVYHVER